MSLFGRKVPVAPAPGRVTDADRERHRDDVTTGRTTPRQRDTVSQDPLGVDADFCYRDDERR
ncbi:MAG: hypothetical protein AB1792_03330 [Candidatus Zixiibacteriota bacterium]